MTIHHLFTWDEEKAATNLRKHRVSFDNAATVLSDEQAERFHIEEFDVRHSTDEEDRFITWGSFSLRRAVVLRIVWTPIYLEVDSFVTRIITARPATPRERSLYERELQSRSDPHPPDKG